MRAFIMRLFKRKPVHPHQVCPHCVHMGTRRVGLKEVDIYTCGKQTDLTVVAVFGDGDKDYRVLDVKLNQL